MSGDSAAEASSAPPAPAAPTMASSSGEARSAIRSVAPLGLAAAPLGVAFGVLVVHSGLAWWWACVFATFIFAGSLEFLLIGLVVVMAPLSQIAVTALLVNLRHVFYSLTFPLHRVHGRAAKVYSTFTLTDEAYALTTGVEAQTWSRTRILILQAAFQVSWVASVTLGALAGSLIPSSVVGLDFAVTALFLVLGIEAFLTCRDVPAGVVALGCALAGRSVFGDNMLAPAMGLFVGYLLVRYAVERYATRRVTERTRRA